MDDWTRIVPDREYVKETASTLLALARSPQDVRTAAGGTEFLIPPYLADLYLTPAPEVEAPKPRRRSSKKEDD
jgi:hypothetical protein